MAKVVASRFALLKVEGEDDNKKDQAAQKSNNAQTNKKKNKKKKGGQDEEVGMCLKNFFLVFTLIDLLNHQLKKKRRIAMNYHVWHCMINRESSVHNVSSLCNSKKQ